MLTPTRITDGKPMGKTEETELALLEPVHKCEGRDTANAVVTISASVSSVSLRLGQPSARSANCVCALVTPAFHAIAHRRDGGSPQGEGGSNVEL